MSVLQRIQAIEERGDGLIISSGPTLITGSDPPKLPDGSAKIRTRPIAPTKPERLKVVKQPMTVQIIKPLEKLPTITKQQSTLHVCHDDEQQGPNENENRSHTTDGKGSSNNVAKALKNFIGGSKNAIDRASNCTIGAWNSLEAGTMKKMGTIDQLLQRSIQVHVEDFAKAKIGRPGLCSQCAKIQLDQCFTHPDEVPDPYLFWDTHLIRVVYHGSWCMMCKILLEMLCREEHDPVLVPYIQEAIEHGLHGVPFRDWVRTRDIEDDALWPFGHSTNIAESAHFITVRQMVQRAGGAALKLAITTVGDIYRGERRKNTTQLAKQLVGSQNASRQHPISVTIKIAISTAKSETPGLLMVRVEGCNSRPCSARKVLSQFTLRAVHDGLSVAYEPNRPLFYGCVVDPYEAKLAMAKTWLADCEGRHGRSCSEHSWASTLRGEAFDIRLIDVNNLCLVIHRLGDQSEEMHAALPRLRFVALSYVWGNVDNLELTSANVDDFSRPHGLRRHLTRIPRTILDAMEVVRATGERFLWCDALCIMQHSDQTPKQIQNMDRVYGNALFTIVAKAGDSAQAGLPGTPRTFSTNIGSSVRPREVYQPVASFENRMNIIAPYLRRRSNTSPKDWSSRAWTLQEQLMSRRLLMFTDQEMVWHCCKTVSPEDMSMEESGYAHAPLLRLSLKTQHPSAVTKTQMQRECLGRSHQKWFLVRPAAFDEYSTVIAQYSRRTMTLDSDVINGLAGLLRVFSSVFQSQCLAGLPLALLDVALTWRPVQPLRRRAVGLGFPSWSWAGWKGAVTYGQPVRMRRDDTGDVINTECIRPLLRYFVFDKSEGSLQPLNGTSRGVPLTDHTIPAEWEAARGARVEHSSICIMGDMMRDDLDARTATHLVDSLLIFYTYTVDRFSLVHADAPGRPSLESKILLDEFATEMGISFDIHTETGRKLIMLSEASGHLLESQPEISEFSHYLVMLVNEDARTGIKRRCGLGTVPKALWNSALPVEELICLG